MTRRPCRYTLFPYTTLFRSLRIMTSSGGTVSPEQAANRAASLALSGPAGGVVGARLLGAAVETHDLLTLDMGGTRSEEHTSELQSHSDLVCRLLLEKKKHNR